MRVLIEVKDICENIYYSEVSDISEDEIEQTRELIGDVFAADSGQINFKNAEGNYLVFRANNLIYAKLVKL